MILKPKLSIEQQIDKLKNKGISFNYKTEDDARAYLKANNNFFKLTSYRKNFIKFKNGFKKDKYENLDFGYLIDLAIIDTRLRIIVLEMALNIEHFAKVSLLNYISEDLTENGYDIIDHYINFLSEDDKVHLFREIDQNKKSIYCGDIVQKYDGNYPIWVFVEIISFGGFLRFYKYCVYKQYVGNKILKDNYHLMLNVKSIRNAAAHNNCIINDLLNKKSEHKTNYGLLNDLSKNKKISRQIRDTQLDKMRIQQFVCLLYAHKKIVTSRGVHDHISERLMELDNRFFRDYKYKGCEPLQNSLCFLKNVIDFWFKKS
jgi:abortive infection bacteriophage resistance protein